MPPTGVAQVKPKGCQKRKFDRADGHFETIAMRCKPELNHGDQVPRRFRANALSSAWQFGLNKSKIQVGSSSFFSLSNG